MDGYRKFLQEDKTGTAKNMMVLVALWAVTGCIIGAMLFVLTSCGSTKRIVQDVGPKVVELTAEECVKIANADNRPDLAELCATVEDLAPFLDLIMAEQKARLAREADGGAPVPSQVPPAVTTPPAASSAPAPAIVPTAAPAPAPTGSIDPCQGKK